MFRLSKRLRSRALIGQRGVPGDLAVGRILSQNPFTENCLPNEEITKIALTVCVAMINPAKPDRISREAKTFALSCVSSSRAPRSLARPIVRPSPPRRPVQIISSNAKRATVPIACHR